MHDAARAGPPRAALLGPIRAWQTELGDTYVLGLVRAALGVFLLANAVRAAGELRAGYFGDFFHWPLIPEWLVVPRSGYYALVAAQVLLSALVVLGGRGARAALLASAVLGAYVLACDRLGFHNNRWALFCYSALVALSPCDRSFCLARGREGIRGEAVGASSSARVGPLWAARLAQVQLCIIYLASGGSKLLDGDWRGGQVLHERFRLSEGDALSAGIPPGVVEILSRADVAHALATMAIATELLLAGALWARRTRAVALWWGVGFHLVIQATSRVETFTWLTLAIYALFATPDVGGRTLLFDASLRSGRAAARAVRWLDWLARFRCEAMSAPGAGGAAVVVVDRDGTRATGAGVLVSIARCTPLLFPLWGPLAIGTSLGVWLRSTTTVRGPGRGQDGA
jgi:hypothetical protein